MPGSGLRAERAARTARAVDEALADGPRLHGEDDDVLSGRVDDFAAGVSGPGRQDRRRSLICGHRPGSVS